MATDVRELCEQAIGLLRGKRLILSADELAWLNALDYANLVKAHAQDEAVVCALHFERVRDRLQQMYPWVFARKHYQYVSSVGGKLPDDCLTVLCVLQDGKPIEYDIRNEILQPNNADEVIYTAKVPTISHWPPIFCDVFIYSLAIEICPAVTGKPEYTQLLEQKMQGLIHQAQQIGAIKGETRLTFGEELYNRAIGLVRGQRTVKETSTTATQQGLDTAGFVNDRMTAEYQACVRAADSVRDYLLSGCAWVFARRTEIPARLSESVPGWRYTYMLPADCLRVIAVIGQDRRSSWGGDATCRNISDFSENVELTEYETAGKELYTNRDVVYVRYTARIEDSSKWDAVFTEAFVIKLAIEVALNVVGDKNIVAILEQRLARLIEDAKMSGAIREETRLPKQRESIRAGAVNRQYLDYSGIPTLPCADNYGRWACYEVGTNELCGWRN